MKRSSDIALSNPLSIPKTKGQILRKKLYDQRLLLLMLLPLLLAVFYFSLCANDRMVDGI